MLILAKLMLIILMFASPLLPYSPAQQNVEKFLRNGIIVVCFFKNLSNLSERSLIC
ncbi:MAG: hypothetical protein F6K17_29265 [Okeania sp. SIO3C4]|nr:hypothetical protein [Okeania sp. SIO3C4]